MRYHTSQRECPNLPVVSIIGSVKVTDQPGNAVKVSRTAVTEQAEPARTNQICATASHHNANINLHDDLFRYLLLQRYKVIQIISSLL